MLITYLENRAKVRFTPIAKNNPARNRAFPIAVKLSCAEVQI